MDKDFNKKCCNNCKHGALFEKCPKLRKNKDFAALCSDEMQNHSIWSKNFSKKLDIKNNYCCDDFENYWLEYPIAVNTVEVDKIVYNDRGLSCEMGTLVKIRPCNKAYENKTYLGFYLGDLPISIIQSFNNKEHKLNITTHNNPAIFVPSINKIIFGCESWWGKINSVEELNSITDNDIENVWYVKLLKERFSDATN